MAYIVMTYIVMACMAMACMVMDRRSLEQLAALSSVSPVVDHSPTVGIKPSKSSKLAADPDDGAPSKSGAYHALLNKYRTQASKQPQLPNPPPSKPHSTAAAAAERPGRGGGREQAQGRSGSREQAERATMHPKLESSGAINNMATMARGGTGCVQCTGCV